jgi:hypothetical protein
LRSLVSIREIERTSVSRIADFQRSSAITAARMMRFTEDLQIFPILDLFDRSVLTLGNTVIFVN